MKKIFSLLFLLTLSMSFVLFTGCDDDDDDPVGAIEECKVPNSVEDDYTNDANRLALRAMQQGGINEVTIPTALIDRMLNALAVVYKSDSLERDTIVSIYGIHTMPTPGFEQITLTVSTDTTQYPWVKNWQDGVRITGNSTIDNLLTVYGLELGSYTEIDIDENTRVASVMLRATNAVNLEALATTLRTVQGINFVRVDTDDAINGNDITATESGNLIMLDYSVAYNTTADDCTTGCAKKRTWSFQVDLAECTAEFVGVSGDPAPPIE